MHKPWVQRRIDSPIVKLMSEAAMHGHGWTARNFRSALRIMNLHVALKKKERTFVRPVNQTVLQSVDRRDHHRAREVVERVRVVEVEEEGSNSDCTWNMTCGSEVPSCRGSSQWINGCVDNKSGFGEEDDSNTRERTCAGVQCTLRRKMKHDALMSESFRHTIRLEPSSPLSQGTHVVCTVQWLCMWKCGVRQVYLSTQSVDDHQVFGEDEVYRVIEEDDSEEGQHVPESQWTIPSVQDFRQ